MAEENLIAATELCIHHNIEVSFIGALQDYGLLTITTIEGAEFIDKEHLKEIERMIHLYHDLDINLEVIDVIHILLENLQSVQKEVSILKNRLRFYENSFPISEGTGTGQE